MNKHHGRKIEVDDKITVHLKNPKNKVLCEVIAVQDGYKNLSQWLANIIENEIIPKRFYFGGKENEKN